MKKLNSGARYVVLFLTLVVGLRSGTSGIPIPQSAKVVQRPASVSELFKLLSPSVFVVETLDSNGTPIAMGSAVSIAKDELVTNRHVVKDGESWRVRQGKNTWPAAIAFLDTEHDLCGLRVAGLKAAPVAFRPSSTLTVGEHVYALGAPEDLELSLSEGLISALRTFDGFSLIQTTAAISHGSSGGGLFDNQGRLAGVTTFTVQDGQNLNFAIPSDVVLDLKNHPATEIQKTDAEKISSQTMFLEQAAQDAMESDDYEKALRIYEHLVELRPDDAFLRSCVGTLYLKLNQMEKAMEACQKGAALDPAQADSWACVGDIYAESRQFPQAEAALRKAVDLDPSQKAQLVNLFLLGRVFAAEDKKEGVMNIYGKLRALDQNYADRFYKLFVEPILNAPDNLSH